RSAIVHTREHLETEKPSPLFCRSALYPHSPNRLERRFEGGCVMPVLCCPAVAVPEYTLTMEQTLELADRIHANHAELPLIRRLIANTKVRKRHLVQPLEDTLRHPGFEERNRVYVREAKARVPAVVDGALANAGLRAHQIDAIIYVSC